ncbi:MAG TPA: BamA/TamA family outer membrane protein [Myxococcota bacterium]|nr:BamA/TamA family outer membrane protein [Myxococcota bacterium]
MRPRYPRSLAALALLLCCSAGARADEEPPPPPPPAEVVGSISWHGVSALAESDLEARLFTQARPWWKPWVDRPGFDEATLEGDMQRIAATYREFAHYRTQASYSLIWDESHHQVEIAIDVDEGPAVHLDTLSVDLSQLPGGAERWKSRLVDKLPLKKGDLFTVGGYGGAKRALLQGLGNAGFADAQLSGGGVVDLATNTASVDWVVHPGPRVVVGQIHISGQKTVSDEVIRRELAFKPGDVYSEADVQKSQRQISDLGVFQSTVIELEPADPNTPPEGPPPGKLTRDVDVKVEERPLRNVRIGLGYGTEDRLRAQVGWLHRNVLGRADSLDIRARYSSITNEFQATLREPHMPDPRTTMWFDARIRDDTMPAYDDVALVTGVAVERPLRLGWSGHVGYNVEWTDVRKVASGIQSQLEQFRLGDIDIGIRRITADSLVDPTKGTWLETDIETASNVLGSEKNYVRWTLDGRAFLPIGPTVLAGRVTLATIAGYGDTANSELPVTKLLYAGGAATVRGYDFQHLGPDDAPGKAIGGQSLLTGSAELRFPIWGELHGATFVDAGQLSRDPWNWRPEKLRTAVGIGFRYSTPLGPVRVDIAGPLDPPAGVDHVRLWFAIGQPF